MVRGRERMQGRASLLTRITGSEAALLNLLVRAFLFFLLLFSLSINIAVVCTFPHVSTSLCRTGLLWLCTCTSGVTVEVSYRLDGNSILQDYSP